MLFHTGEYMIRRLLRLIVFAASVVLIAPTAQARAPDKDYRVAHMTNSDVTVEVGSGLSVEKLVHDFGPMYTKATGETLTWRHIAEANPGNVIPTCRLDSGKLIYHADRSTTAWDVCPIDHQTVMLITGAFTSVPMEPMLTHEEEMADLASHNAKLEGDLASLNACLANPTADCLESLVHLANGNLPEGVLRPVTLPAIVEIVTVPYVPTWSKVVSVIEALLMIGCVLIVLYYRREYDRRGEERQNVINLITAERPDLGFLSPVEALEKFIEFGHAALVYAKHEARVVEDTDTRSQREISAIVREQSRLEREGTLLTEREAQVTRREALIEKHLGSLCKEFGFKDEVPAIVSIDRAGGVSGIFRLAELRLMELRERVKAMESQLETVEKERDVIIGQLTERLGTPSARSERSADSQRRDWRVPVLDPPVAIPPNAMDRFWLHVEEVVSILHSGDPIPLSTPRQVGLLAKLAQHPVLFTKAFLGLTGAEGTRYNERIQLGYISRAMDHAQVLNIPFLNDELFGNMA